MNRPMQKMSGNIPWRIGGAFADYHKRMSIRCFCALLFMATLSVSPAAARACAPKVKQAWILLAPASVPMQAGFARIENPCPMPVTIVAVSSATYASAQLHETQIREGISRMRAVPELRIPPHGEVVLKPGGLHLMLMQSNTPLKPGSKVMVQFKLKEGGSLLGEFVTRPPTL